MATELPKVLLVSTRDIKGGANLVGYRLLDGFRKMGVQAKMVVGFKSSSDPDVIPLSDWAQSLSKNLKNGNMLLPMGYRMGRILENSRKKYYRHLKKSGKEVFFFPAAKGLYRRIPVAQRRGSR